jgi:hypothetical protein
VTEQAGATEAETRADVVQVVHLELFDERGALSSRTGTGLLSRLLQLLA